MTQINLLPWREQARQEKKIEFLIIIGFFIGMTLLFILLIHIYLASLIHEQNKRNEFIQTTLGDKQVLYTGFKDKKQKQAIIESQLQFINSLRDKSFRAVKLMNELVKIVPHTVTLDKLVRENNKITLIGKAQSELQITLLMKNIAKSDIFNQPVLTRISGVPGSNETDRVFELEALQKDGAAS